MNEIKTFNNAEFGSVRTIEMDGEPYFVGKDVAEILGYSEPRSAVSKKVDVEDRGVAKMETPSGIQEMTVINESGLYSLILSSKLPTAKKFKHWVTAEVLPTIRKTGSYSIARKPDSYMIEDPVARATRWIEEYQEKLALEEKIKQDEPLVDFANQVSDSCNAIDVSALAKVLRDENIKIGRNRLYKWLRDNKIIRSNNEPYQKYIDNGMMSCVEYVYHTPYGDKTGIKTLINGKGQIYIAEKLRKRFSQYISKE